MNKELKIQIYEVALEMLLTGENKSGAKIRYCCHALMEACRYCPDTRKAWGEWDSLIEEFAKWCKPEDKLYPLDKRGTIPWWPADDRESRIAALQKAIALAKEQEAC